MPVATAGTLITCDASVKQVLLWRNEQLAPQDQFIIADVDASHLVVKTDQVALVEEQLNEELERNHYDPRSVE